MTAELGDVQSFLIDLQTRYFDRFHVLPYNRYQLDKSIFWWLSPTTANPAFPVGKILATTQEEITEPGTVFCGFNVEKGLQQDAVGKPSEQMQDDWFWHRFVEIANIPLADAVRPASEAIGGKLEIDVAAGLPAGDAPWARVHFESDGDQLIVASHEIADGILDGVAACESFPSFADQLRDLNGAKSAWHWMDIVIGKPFMLDSLSSKDVDDCARMLEPFRQWMH